MRARGGEGGFLTFEDAIEKGKGELWGHLTPTPRLRVAVGTPKGGSETRWGAAGRLLPLRAGGGVGAVLRSLPSSKMAAAAPWRPRLGVR